MNKSYIERDKCRLCNSENLSLVMSYGNMPLAGGFVVSGDPKASMKFPLDLFRCNDCTLMQTGQDINPDLMFSQYSYISKSSPGLVEHFGRLANSLTNRFSGSDRVYIDIGCNDGTLINWMRYYGENNVLGVDPSDVSLSASREDDWHLVNSYLTPEVADSIVGEYGHAYLITACNVLAHNPDPHPIVEGMRRLLYSNGVVVAEVHYQGSLLRQTQFDTVYHEHTCYYSLESLVRLFSDHGLHIWGVSYIQNHGGSIRVFASPEGHKLVYYDESVKSMISLERNYTWTHFASDATRVKNKLLNEIFDLKNHNKSIWAYGASGRSTILLNWCNLNEDDIPIILDQSPLRIGKVVPGSMIPIRSVSVMDSVQPEVILITAWNYADSIRFQHPNYYGKWLVPLPNVLYL